MYDLKYSKGRPQKRWLDDVKAREGINCHRITQNRQEWKLKGRHLSRRGCKYTVEKIYIIIYYIYFVHLSTSHWPNFLRSGNGGRIFLTRAFKYLSFILKFQAKIFWQKVKYHFIILSLAIEFSLNVNTQKIHKILYNFEDSMLAFDSREFVI